MVRDCLILAILNTGLQVSSESSSDIICIVEPALEKVLLYVPDPLTTNLEELVGTHPLVINVLPPDMISNVILLSLKAPPASSSIAKFALPLLPLIPQFCCASVISPQPSNSDPKKLDAVPIPTFP